MYECRFLQCEIMNGPVCQRNFLSVFCSLLLQVFQVQVSLSRLPAAHLPLALSFPISHSFLVQHDLDQVIHIYASAAE